jgi:heptosyltransferase-2
MKILIIQTAFIGDVILATSLVEQTKAMYPNSEIHFLLRHGNQSLLKYNPHINKVIVWNKSKSKYSSLIKLALDARSENYDLLLNIQRFTSSGIFCLLSGAKITVGFDKNPLSIFFTKQVKHKIPFIKDGEIQHEVQRNALLLNDALTTAVKPKLYFSKEETSKVDALIEKETPYIVLAPSSVWFTKQWSKEKWIELTKRISKNYTLFFIGGPDDKEYIETINQGFGINLCGVLSLTESAYLMKNAQRVLVNDSAPLHLASSVNANTTAIFCSTVKDFGYFPLSDNSCVISTDEELSCRPCGLHGKKACPLTHFKCSETIDVNRVIESL